MIHLRVQALSCALLLLAASWRAAPALGQTVPATSRAAESRQLSIDDALGMAEQTSDDIAIARAGVARTEGQRIRARSTFFPQVYASASYIRTLKTQYASLAAADSLAPKACNSFVVDPSRPIDQRVSLLESALGCSSFNFGDLPFGRPNNWNLGLAASWNVFNGGRDLANVRSATAQRHSAEVGLTAARAQLMLDITQAYYNAVLSERLVAISVATLAQADTTLRQTQLARQVGNSPEFDLLRAQVTRDNQVPVVIQRRSDRDIAYQRLRQLLNIPQDQSLVLTSDLGDSTAAPGTKLASLLTEAPDTATEVRAPVRQAVENVKASDEAFTAARAQRWPSFTISSAYGRVAYPGTLFPTWSSFLDNWTLTGALQFPLFLGGAIKGDEQVARANQEEAQARLNQTRKLAALDTRTALSQLASAQAMWDASSGTAEQASRAYQIAEVRYREGISTQTELSDSRIQLQQAQANRAQAARDLQVAKMRLALIRDLPLSTGIAGTATPTATPTLAVPSPSTTTRPPATNTGQQIPGVVTSQNTLGVTP